ncbi:MAG TPA: thiazole synthase, partial [Paenibacillaceae bacterium]|nr:thiazole synthase [Paenibacillaceae bacterium]
MTLRIGPYEFNSRLLLGTGKFPDFSIQRQAVDVSETEILTFAVRRMNIFSPEQPNFLEQLDLKNYKLLPNTAGASTAEEAVRIARLSKASGLCDMIKVEVIADPRTLLPDPIETLEATKILVNEGFIVLPYINDDPIMARKLQEAGAHAIMPGASPIGSGQGILNPLNISIIIEEAKVPVIVDAGIGSPADAAIAMELGAEGVLLNSAVAHADDPV